MTYSSHPVSADASEHRPGAAAAAVSTSLVLTLALQSAVPPFANSELAPVPSETCWSVTVVFAVPSAPTRIQATAPAS